MMIGIDPAQGVAHRGDGRRVRGDAAVGGLLVRVTGLAGLGWRRCRGASFVVSLVALGAYTVLGFHASPVSLVTLGLLVWLVATERPWLAGSAVVAAPGVALISGSLRAGARP